MGWGGLAGNNGGYGNPAQLLRPEGLELHEQDRRRLQQGGRQDEGRGNNYDSKNILQKKIFTLHK